MPINNITTLQEAKDFIKDCMDYIGIGFHPDTPFEDYDFADRKESMFSNESAALNNNLMDQAFEQFDEANEDIYEYSISLL